MSIIELITHEFPQEVQRARIDRAIVTNQDLVERPYWFRNVETGQLYFDIYATIAWPSEVTDSKDGLPGYIAIMGVVRPDSKLESDPKDAKFQLLDEFETQDVPTLLQTCLKMREKYGYGVQKNLLRVWVGDPDRFLTTLSLFNERIIEKDGHERNALMVSPPDDFYTLKIFDNYVRDIRSVLSKEKRRLYFGYNDILPNKLSKFERDDPCILAIGGLVHTLLCRCTWMDSCTETAFTVEEEV